ncbi:MAG: hypothetical protein WDO24_31020 [Pseudomonadota bacterium]
MRANLARLKLSAEIVTADAATWQAAVPCDAILLDAPCSATGAARRHPDVLHLKSPNDVARLAIVQDQLLDNAVRQLKPGGTLVYCTCSLEAAEGPARIERLLASGRAGAPQTRRFGRNRRLGGIDHTSRRSSELALSFGRARRNGRILRARLTRTD